MLVTTESLLTHISRSPLKETVISQCTVICVLYKDKYKSYTIHLGQELWPGDTEQKLQFVSTMIEFCDNSPGFVWNIIYTDEASFTLHKTPNRQNVRVWSQDNPHEVLCCLQSVSKSAKCMNLENWIESYLVQSSLMATWWDQRTSVKE